MQRVQLYAIQSPGDTRWLSNRESLDFVMKSLPPLMERLEHVSVRLEELEATNLIAQLTEVDTHLGMFMAEQLLDSLGRLCKVLQV